MCLSGAIHWMLSCVTMKVCVFARSDTLDVKLCNSEGVCVYVRSETLDVKLCNNEGVCVCVCQERYIGC